MDHKQQPTSDDDTDVPAGGSAESQSGQDQLVEPSKANEHPDLLNAFAELARIHVGAQPPHETLRHIAELAKQTLDEVKDVSLTVIDRGRPRSVVFTGPLAVDLDERQYEMGFGPCLDAAKTGQTIIVDSRQDDTPYRDFARVADRAGVRHIVSVGMPLAQQSIGGLNIYRTTAAPYSAAFLQHAEVFAGYAAVAVANITSHAAALNEATNLRIAIDSRAGIEQAKGIIMARDRCTPDEAFDMLTRISQQQNIKLRDLAKIIVDSAQK
jgi:GAF domain-containing protein